MRKPFYYPLRFIFCIMCFASFTSWNVSAQDWEFVDVSPERWNNIDLNDVFSISDQGWAVGEDGAIVHTHDGTRWHDQNSGVDVDLHGVYFEDTLRGWVAGAQGTILNTEDGGTTWKQHDSLTTTTLHDVDFVNERHGWIVGRSGIILHTDNYGVEWEVAVAESPGWSDLNAVHIQNVRSGWAVGNSGTILRWNGVEWLRQTSPSMANLRGVYFTSVTSGWIVGDGGTILHTSDAGAQWVSCKDRAPFNNLSLYSVYFPEGQSTYGWIVGRNGIIMYTQDSGARWWKSVSPTSKNLNAVSASNTSEIRAVGDNGSIIQSSNRGQTWVSFVNPPYGDFWDVSFNFDWPWVPEENDYIADPRGWIVGDDGVILNLQADGVNWREYPSPTSRVLYGIYMVDKFNGCAVGEAGTIIKSRNTAAGIAWDLQESPTGETLYGVYLSRSDNGWAVGANGTIIHWDGMAWTRQNSRVPQTLHGVFFIDDSEGWAVGDSGIALYTSNGGLNWTPIDTGISWPLRAAYFVDSDNGWIVGEGGTVLYWKNGNFTEQSGQIMQGLALYDIDFLNNGVSGWISASGGIVISTANGGNGWNLHLAAPGAENLYGIDLTQRGSDFVGFAVGQNSAIVSYTGTAPAPVSEVKLISPSGNITTLSPTFRWETDKPSLTHNIFIDDDADPYDSVPFPVTGGTSLRLPQQLEPGTYYWGIEVAGTRFTPLEFIVWPPTEVTLISPPSSGYTLEASPTFQWNCNNVGLSEQGLLTYNLFIDDDGTPYDGVSIPAGGSLSHTLSSADPLPSLPGGQYTWGIETSGLETVRSDVFILTVDLSPPTGTIEINDGAGFTNSLEVTLTLTASDPLSTGTGVGSGVSEMQFSNDGSNWSVPEAFAGTKAWDLSQLGGDSKDGEKRVYAKFKDALGHWMMIPASDTIAVDTMPPTGMLVINDGAAVTGPENITLSLSVSDDRSGVEPGGQMVLSNDGETWSPPLSYAASREEWRFTFYGGNDDEGIKTVYVKFKDAAGNWMQDPVSDTIELDKTGPTGTILINGGDALTDVTLVDLTLAASDNNAVQFMWFTNGNDKWSPREPFSNRRENWDLSAEEYGGDDQRGKKTVYVRFIDSVGNESIRAASDDIEFRTEVSVSVQISSPEIEGKIKNNDIVGVEGSTGPGLVEVEMDVLDDIGRSLDLNLSGVIYDSETGDITGSFPVGELTAKTIQFEVSVEDIVGNRANATSNILNVDNDPPANVAISINQGQITNSTSIGLSMSADDALEMYIDGDLVGQKAWIAYAETLRVTLTGGDSVKEIRARFRDDMGNESAEISDQIVLDTILPTGSIVINSGDEHTGNFVVALTLMATDENGITGYQLSNDDNTWSDESQMLTGDLQIYEWDLRDYGGSSDEGARTVYVRYKDKAGNWGETASDDILVDTTAPTINVWPVEDNQEAMQSVKVSALIKSDSPIIEASLHYRRKGSIEYTVVTMTKLPPDTYVAEIPGPDVTLEGVEYYLSASDDRYTITLPERNAPIAPKSFTVVDRTQPIIEHEPVKTSPVNIPPKITAKVTDAVGVKQVRLFYKVLPERSFTKVDMLIGPIPDEYSADIIALEQLGIIAYYIEAVDFSDNSRIVPPKGNTLPYNISFVDTESPVITHTEIADGQEAGDTIPVVATVRDNMTVDSVTLKYKLPGKAETFETEMANVGEFYSAEIPGELVTPGTIEYSITASDGSPQSEDAVVSHSFTVVDTTPPDIKLTLAPSEMTVYNEMSIQAEVTDNVAVKTVILYYKGVQDAMFNTISMRGVRKKYSASIPGQGWPGKVKFYVYAEDSHGVSSTNPEIDPQNSPHEITVIDETPPVIVHVPLFEVREAGVPVTITATATDNVEVSNVSLHYRKAGAEGFELAPMTKSDSGSLYSGIIPGSAVFVPKVEYYIKAVDEAFKVTTDPPDNPDTLPHSFSVADTVPPEIVYDPSGLATVVVTDTIIVTVEATDLTGIKEVKVFYRTENESDFKFLISADAGDGKFSAQIPTPLLEINIHYYIQVEDNSGNTSTSPVEDPAGQPHSIFVSDPFPPLPPTRLTANSASGGRIVLTWEHSESSDVDGYNIYTDNGSGTVDYSSVFDFVPLSSLPADSAAWESPALGEGLYKFVVRAVDKSGNVEDNTNSVPARADATKPEPATNVRAESRPGGRIRITWTLSVSKDAAAYNIYWDNAQVEIDYSKPLVRVSDPGVSWISDELRDGVIYRFAVRCEDQAGNEEENIDFKSAQADATPPGVPTGLTCLTHTVGEWSNQPLVTVRWTSAEDNNGTGLDGYSLLWDESSGTLPDEVMDIGNVVIVTATLSGTQYLHLRAVDKAGNWSIGAAHLGPFKIDFQPPQAPTNLKALPQADGRIRLEWGASESTDVVRYNIYWDNGSGLGVDYSTSMGSVTELTWTSPELANGTTHEFAVRSEDQAGNEEKNTRSVSGIADSQPPSIVHKPIAGLLEQEIADVTIEATVTDASGLQSVKLHYRKRGVTNYEETEMSEGASNKYGAEIPATAFSSAGVDYYISASDEAGNVTKHPILTIAVGTVLEMAIDPASENEILLGDGSSIYFPAEAVTSHRNLTITVPEFIPGPQKGLGKHIVTREFGMDEDLGKSIRFTLLYDNKKVAGEDESKLAVYLWNGKTWDFLSDVDEQDNQATVTTMRLGIFSIMGDYEPPEVSDLQPSGYAEPEIKITARIEDSGSGIDPQGIRILLNGQAIEVPGTALRDEELVLPLPQPVQLGSYSMQLTVKDNVGNQTVATGEFHVEGKLVLKDVYCYPNPFRPSVGANFAYILTESVSNVTIRIFGMDGKLAREIEGTTSVGRNVIEWDGRDEQDKSVLSSVYICHIEAEGSEDTVTETIKIAGWE